MADDLKPDEAELLRYLEDLQEQNPAEYEQFMAQLQQQAAAAGGPLAGSASSSDSVAVVPAPGFVAKTRSVTNKGRKVFINLCSSDHVDPCGEMPTETEAGADPEVRFRVPLSLGPPHDDLDKDGAACTVYDCVFNPQTIEDAKKDRALRDLVMQLVCSSVEQKYQEELSADFTFPKLRTGYKGISPLPQFMRAKKGPPEEAKMPASEGGGFGDAGAGAGTQPPAAKIQDLDPTGEAVREAERRALLALPTPAHILRPVGQDSQYLDAGEGGPDAGEDLSLRQPASLELKMHLPGLAAAEAEAEVDVSVSSGDLEVAVPGRYFLALELPNRVRADSVDAAFEAERCILTVTMSVLREDEAVLAASMDSAERAAARSKSAAWEAQLAKEARARKAKLLLEQRRKEEAMERAAREAKAAAEREKAQSSASTATGSATKTPRFEDVTEGDAAPAQDAEAPAEVRQALGRLRLANTIMLELES